MWCVPAAKWTCEFGDSLIGSVFGTLRGNLDVPGWKGRLKPVCVDFAARTSVLGTSIALTPI
jgi:hypothetical protein